MGALVLGTLALAAVLADVLVPFDPRAFVGPSLAPPGAVHLLGTNDVGQDIFSRLVHGARISLALGLSVAFAATLIGVAAGMISGYLGGWVDVVVMRLVDAVLAIPFLPLLIVLQAFLGAGLGGMALVLVLVMWARPARELRAQVLAIREQLHVQAAVAMGASSAHILRRHVFPGLVPLVVPQLIRTARGAILSEASLSFLGLGDPTAVTWGSMLFHAQARSAYLTGAWLWWVVPPGLLIGATVLATAMMGYGLEERARPRLRMGWLPAAHDALEPEPDPPERPTVLSVHDLTVDYGDVDRPVLKGASLAVEPGETVGLVGASGSGKSTLVLAALGLLPEPARIRRGAVVLAGASMGRLDGEGRRSLRGRTIGLVPQGSQSALNPVRSVAWHFREARHARGQRLGADDPGDAARLLEDVGLGAEHLGAFSHELSGGMRQRVLIALALAGEPAVILADEPTTGLDLPTQRSVLDLLQRTTEDRGLAVVLVSHDRMAVDRYADRTMALEGGRIRPEGDPPDRNGIAAPSARQGGTRQVRGAGDSDAEPVLEAVSVSKRYVSARGAQAVDALSSVSLRVGQGESLGIVGPSGAGKSTLIRLLVGLEEPDSGTVLLDGHPLFGPGPSPPRAARNRLQLVFQDPYASLPPHLTVNGIVAEPLVIRRVSGDARGEEVEHALVRCGLDPGRYGRRHPHELSGGERQRVALARAFVTRPRVLLADEPLSLLDAHLRADLTALLRTLCDEHGTAMVYVSHDLTTVAALCRRTIVLDHGAVVEDRETDALLRSPETPISRRFLEAVF